MQTVWRTDILCGLFPPVIQLFLSFHLEAFLIDNWLTVCIAVAPAVIMYALIRFVLPPLLAALLSSGLLIILCLINRTKTALTYTPLVWEDLFAFEHFPVIIHYVAWDQIAVCVIFIGLCFIAYTINPFVNNKHTALLRVVILIVLIPMVIFPYDARFDQGIFFSSHSVTIGKIIDQIRSSANIKYDAWNWEANVRNNGLLLHLVQTSRKNIPRLPVAEERRIFSGLIKPSGHLPPRPKNIIVIMCESCWHDTNHFNGLFEPLREQGMVGFRTISPVYGGGTVNATFEFLTGLPARGKLSGVIYQEYAKLMQDNVHAFPRYLKRYGYRTVAAHNFGRYFWQRHIVNPKLGFDRYLSLENMHDNRHDLRHFPDDGVLFDAALQEIHQTQQPLFLYLTTVYTHGGYFPDNDDGEGDYQRRLDLTLKRLADFVREAKAHESDTLILMFADHKPALTKYFYENQVIGTEQFAKTGEVNEDFLFQSHASQAVVGDVPAYIYYRDQTVARNFARAVNKLPVFCLGQSMDAWFTGVGLPGFVYAEQAGTCVNFHQVGYVETVGKYPDWLYSLSVLDRTDR